ncbi:hypothetical protein KK062_29325 [Fulvivirgaceae bacterium PWU5]|uniref:Uncharacterized protein n=1 Tax=Dawidia cretensis TaxID=2782350 RepID=A0AAP2E3J1_9BACT|nr:hypothetical protein [Dawidia cretensis]MBT1712381.1 hypothetical protein [Dawidia cretensis]
MTSLQETATQTVIDYILTTKSGSMLALIAVILLAGYHWKRINIIITIRGRKEGQKKKSL